MFVLWQLRLAWHALCTTSPTYDVQVLALERTLDQMIEANTAYSKSFRPVNEKRAFEERAALRERLDKVYDRLKFKRGEERALAGDAAAAESRQAQLAQEEAALATGVQQLERRCDEAATAIQVHAAGLLASLLLHFTR